MFRQYKKNQRLTSEMSALSEQIAAAEKLRAENQRLAEELKSVSDQAQSERRELLRLRNQSARARQIEQENARLKTERDHLLQQQAETAANPAPTAAGEEDEKALTPEQQLVRAKLNHGRSRVLALVMFAADNNSRLPAQLDQATAYLHDNEQTRKQREELGIDDEQLEVLFGGSTLSDFPSPGKVVLLRDRVPFQLPDGKWARTYHFADGHSELIAAPTADGFMAREKELGLITR